jgi:hypothetical protein
MQPHKPTSKKLGLLAALCLSGALSVSAQSLTHRYSFNDTAGSSTFIDSAGSADGALNNATAGNPTSASLDGSQLQLDGTGGYATLPGGLISVNTQVTIEFWASFSSANNVWTRVFAFGDQNGSGGADTSLDYCHYAGGNYQNLNYQTPAGSAYANYNSGLNGATNVHVTVVVDPVNSKLYYYNGTTLVSVQNGSSIPPLSGLNDSLSLIGRSLFDIDPVLSASINEFRIYSGVLPISTVALNDASGPDSILSSPGTIQALHFSAPVNPLVVNQLSQQGLKGDFSNVTGLELTLYGGATFTSLDTNVVTIGTNGAVKAVAPGSTKVVASYGGLSATNSLTVVSIPATLIHRYSFTSDASDSVNGANGTLIGTAAISGGQLVLDGSFGSYLDLPAGQINIATNPAVTFDAWVTFGNATTWAELFGFGNTNNGNGLNNIACVPCAEGGGFRNWGITENLPNGRTPGWSHGWNNFTAHITCVLDPPTGAISIYRDGVLEIAEYDATAPISSIATNYAFIGRSFFTADPYLPASVDEFRIYSGALTPAQVALVQQAGPSSTTLDVGALSSIVVVVTNYPAYASLVPPVIRANYANLANFNLLPTVTAGGNVTLSGPQGLVVTSSDPTIVSVNAQNMLTTHRPGTVTLVATYGGKTNSATVQVKNMAVLAHRYNFNTDGDASDSVAGANGTLQGGATVSGGQLQLTGNNGDYLQLPAGMLQNNSAVTVDTWANLGPAQNWARLWEFTDVGPATQNEFYFAPGWNPNPPNGNFYNAGFPWGGSFFTSGALGSQLLHITCEYGNGWMAVYTNGVLESSATNLVAPASAAGTISATIGHSPFNDPGINGSIDEFRIFNGVLAPDEIVASDLLGPNQTLSTIASLSVSQSSGNIALNWPLANAGFSVQTSSNLSNPTWITLTNAPSLTSSNTWQVTVPVSSGARFFRLWR